MKQLLTAIACFFALSMSAQALYNPDVDGDGCITVTDVLGVLSLFDTCDEGTTLYYFHYDNGKHPFVGSGGGFDIDNFGTATWWLTDENDEWFESTDFGEVVEWWFANQGEVLFDSEVNEIDSVMNVTVPLSESIPNGSINMPPTTSGGGYFIIVNQELDFDFISTPVFYHPGGFASPVIEHEFQWQGSTWSLLQLTNYAPSLSGYVFNVLCGY